jgi:hypothetical protein
MPSGDSFRELGELTSFQSRNDDNDSPKTRI